MKKIFALLVALLLLVAASPISLAREAGEPTQTPAPEIDLGLDREGNPVTLPETIERIISMGPSNTEVLVALGFGDNIIAADEYSYNVEGLAEDIPLFSMMEPDGEQMVNLNPDVIFITGMSRVGGEDPLKLISDAGICVIYIPSSPSIQDIIVDIRYLAAVLNVPEKGEEIIAEMESAINIVKEAAQSVTEMKKVYFEISAAPYMYSFGQGVFLNEMIELIGAENILAEQEGWLSVTDEALVAANPDVILTSVNYIEDPQAEIIARPGWSGITAVQNGDVYVIDTDSSNRPSQNIIKALLEMAQAIYPELYQDIYQNVYPELYVDED